MISRTALITTGAIAAVVVAGSFAMGANLGLFGSSNDASAVGQLDLAEAQAAPAASGSGSAESAALTSWSTQDYDVDGAGIVSLRWQGTTLEVARAQPAGGWTAAVQPSAAGTATVDFTDSGGTVYRFNAQLHPDGSVQAAVDNQAASATGSRAESEEREGAEHEAEEHHYEGGDDDD